MAGGPDDRGANGIPVRGLLPVAVTLALD
jgi:hypothetical protein